MTEHEDALLKLRYVSSILYQFERKGQRLIDLAPCDEVVKWNDDFVAFAGEALWTEFLDGYQHVKARCAPGAFNFERKLTSNRSAWMRELRLKLTSDDIRSSCTTEQLKVWDATAGAW